MMDFISPRDLVSDLKDLKRPRLVASAHISEGIWKTYVIYFSLLEFSRVKNTVQFVSTPSKIKKSVHLTWGGLPSVSRPKLLNADHVLNCKINKCECEARTLAIFVSCNI